MARLGARIRKGTMETMKTLGTAAVARSPMTPVTNVAKAFSAPGMLQSPTVGQGLKTTNGNMVRLGDVATYINGYAFKPADWSTEGVLIIRIQDLTGNSYKANRFKGKIDKRYEVLNGDVLISWSASLGVYVWSGEKAVLNQHIFKVQFDKTQVDKSFFVHQVECILKRAIGEAHGATMKHLTKPAFDALPFYLPDIQKQKAIADLLDKISHLIALRKRQLSKLDELVKSRFVEMFGDARSNSKLLPVRRLDSICSSIVRGPFGSALKKEFFVAKGANTYKVYEQKHAIQKNATIGSYYIDANRFGELRRFECKSGDIIMSCSGTMGEFFQLPAGCEQGVMNQALCKFTLSETVLPVYFLNYMKNAIGLLRTQGSGIQNIAAVSYVKSMPFLLPPLALQREFAAFVENVDKLAFKAKASLEKLETLKKAMMQKYFN